ncbi:3-hydroxyacyl-ACP dehydratase FabZ [Neisseria shayeganii]|uniref:3-hydroxyacyl-[acyl-carrier-protein] dehydratase FabZ n=1 Tax=Neisseria shayeganii 871 TaxID=1032488 RepID=G4CIK5_9NEIS|nr:3-hydroxyacyl-ACP dehydratase FabZ [Neisseria shayeganii]EGY52340.1 (3R)-hydroxymyristoyl-[acyl-carrier-protein] dehydratase [Neisseria shayeganii 871]
MAYDLPIDIRTLQQLLPHRYPFLLIDRVTAYEPEKTLTAIKNVTINEPFFQGHFPGFPVMPGVLIIEALAQAAGTLAILSRGGRNDDEIYFFVGIDNARFKRQVVPGDQLVFEVEVITHKRDIGKFKAVAKVDGQIAAEAEIMCAKRTVEK